MSLLAHYYLNGDVKDTTQNNKNLELLQGNISYDNGKSGLCLDVTNRNTVLTLPIDLSYSELSFGCWFKINVIDIHTQYIISGTNDSNDDLISILINPNGYLCYHVGNALYDDIFKINIDTWYHTFISINKDRINIVVNGKIIVNNDFGMESIGLREMNQTNTSINIGGKPNFAFNTSGYIADIRLYDNTVSLKECKEIYNSLVVYYTMEYYYNNLKEYDRSGARNNGIMNKEISYSPNGALVGTGGHYDFTADTFISIPDVAKITDSICIYAWVHVGAVGNIVNCLTGNHGYRLYIQNDNISFSIMLNGELQRVNLTANFEQYESNNWHLVYAAYDKEKIICGMDYDFIEQSCPGNISYSDDEPITIGGNFTGKMNGFKLQAMWSESDLVRNLLSRIIIDSEGSVYCNEIIEDDVDVVSFGANGVVTAYNIEEEDSLKVISEDGAVNINMIYEM